MIFTLRVLCCTILLLVLADAGAHERQHDGEPPAGAIAADAPAAPVLGAIDFPTSARDPAAQAAFVRGMLLLHLFEYERARVEFQQAERLQPDFAMAYWGEAMTHNHPIWDQRDTVAAEAVLARLGATPAERAAKAGSAREREFLAALDALFATASKAAADRAYLAAMQTMARRYPNDHEVRLFQALALLGVHAGVRDIDDYLRAAAIAQDVFSANPEHPGAAHYLIHAVDDPVHAILGLSAARALARMAPDAGHSQHMASHIFLALGMWDELIAVNRAAIKVVDADRARQGQPPRHTGHYNFWLLYGWLQTGREDQALTLLRQAYADRARSSEPPPAALQLDADDTLTGSLVQMWARYLIETRGWQSELLDWRFELGDSTDPKLTEAYVRSLAGYRRGENLLGRHWRKTFERERARLSALIAAELEPVPEHRQFLERLAVQSAQLAALEKIAAGDHSGALVLAAEASQREGAMPAAFGPPAVDHPAAEFLGDLLSEAGQPNAARAAYQHQLRRSQGKTRSLEGAQSKTP